MKNEFRVAPASKSQGASLPTVIMVVALMFTLAFTVVAIAFNHLNLSFRSSNNSKAEHLAEAVLALAIEKASAVGEIDSFGITKDKTIKISFDSYPSGNLGYLSFDQSEAASLGVPYSTNNRSESSVEGSNSRVPVPGQSLHLVARAEVGGAYSTVEAVVEIPKSPYSIASGGAIRSNGGLLVASIRPGQAYDLSLPIHEDDLEPGNLVSNSTVGDNAIVLTGSNKIMGDIQSASGITVEADTQVFGQTKLNAEKVKLPKLNASSYDPLGTAPDGSEGEVDPADVQIVNSGAGTLAVKGYNVYGNSGSHSVLTVDNGVKLNGGVLYVNGDLNVSAGGVTGKGAIIATGKITIEGGGEASTDNQAALIADGDIVLRGTAAEKAKFAGLIYTNGNLQAENMRLAGVFVASGGQDDASGVPTTPSEVSLQNTELYQVNELARLQLSDEFKVPDTLNSNTTNYSDVGNDIGPIPLVTSYDPASLRANLANYVNPNSGPNEPAYLFKYKSGSEYYTVRKVLGQDGVLRNMPVLTTGPDKYVLDGNSLGMIYCGVPVHSEAEAVTAAMAKIEAVYLAAGKTMSEGNRTSVTTSAVKAYNSNAAGFQMGGESVLYTEGLQGGGANGEAHPFKWKIDLSDFINESDRMRVCYWARFR